MNLKITSLKAREIIDSRGFPTIETAVMLECGASAVASVPSGASTGTYEAVELRDNNSKRFNGKGVLKAVENVNNIISPSLMQYNCSDFIHADRIISSIDGTDNFSSLGANATLSVSLALAKAHARAYSMPLYRYLGGTFGSKLPVPMMNIINGGAHASNNIDIQEFMIVPIGFDSFREMLRVGCEIYHALKNLLKKEGFSVAVGDEGGFAPNLANEEEALDFIIKAIHHAGYSTEKVKIALDIASSEWYCKEGGYFLPKSKERLLTIDLIDRITRLCEKYPIISVEDPLGENDFEGWIEITKRLKDKVMLVGDDLFVTNKERLQSGIDLKMGNSILIKPNQIGSLSKTMEVIRLANSNSYKTIISHRSGDTDDTSIADIAVAVNADFIKSGAPCRMERVCKYNRLLKIEDEIKHLK